MTPWTDRPRGVIYDATDNAVRRAAREQQAVAVALASLAPVHAEVVALLQSMPARRYYARGRKPR